MIDYPLGTKQTQIYAGFIYPRGLIERTLPLDNLSELQPVVSDSVYHPHEMNSRLYDLEIARITKYIYKLYSADHVEITSLNMNLETAKINLISYFIPAYIYQTNLYGLVKYKIINGYAGLIEFIPQSKFLDWGSVNSIIYLGKFCFDGGYFSPR